MLARRITEEGYEVWWDQDLPPHLSYGDVITAKITEARAVVVVWSETAVQSEWVRAEADVARNQKKLIQAASQGVIPPLPFNQIQCASLSGWGGEPDHPGWVKIKESLLALCRDGAGAASTGAAPPPRRTPPPRPERRATPPPLPPPPPPPTGGSKSLSTSSVLIGCGAGGALMIVLLIALGSLAPSQTTPPLPLTATPTATLTGAEPSASPAPAPDPTLALTPQPEASQAMSGSFNDTTGSGAGYAGIYVTVTSESGAQFAAVDANMQLNGYTLTIPAGETLRTVLQPTEYWLVQRSDGTVGYIHSSTIDLTGVE